MNLYCNTNPNSELDPNIPFLADFLRIISEENRLKIICFLQSGEQCVCQIWLFLGQPQNLISHHLKVLKDFNLLSSRKEGLNVYYSINKEGMDKYKDIFNQVLNRKE